MVNSGSDIYDGCTLEVVVSIQPAAEENVEIRPHSLSIHSYKTPTFCDFCGEMLFGMFKQVSYYSRKTFRYYPFFIEGIKMRALSLQLPQEMCLQDSK